MGRLRAAIAVPVLMVSSSLMALIYTVPAPVLFNIGKEYGPWIAQGMSNLPSLGIIVGGPTAGWLVHRWGTRGLLLPCLGIYGMIGPLAQQIYDPYILLASRFALGLCAAGAVSASTAIISSRYEGTARLRILGLQGAIAAVFGLTGLKLSGTLAASMGSWRSPFILYGIGVAVLPAALFAFGRDSQARDPDNNPAVAALSRFWPLWPLYLQVILLFGAGFSTGLQLSFKLGEHGIVDTRIQSNVILLGSLMNAISSAAYGFVLPKLGGRNTFVLLIASMAVGALVIGLAGNAVYISCGSALMGVGSGMVGPHLIGKLLARISDSERTGAVGLLYSCIFIGEFLNPIFMQPLRSEVTSDGAFLALGVLLGAGALAALLPARSRA